MINKRLDEKSHFTQCWVFNSLSPADIQNVYDKSERIECIRSSDETNNIIFEKGDIGDCMYVLIDGEVDVIQIDIDGKTNVIVKYRKPGEFFGEQALIDSLNRRALRAIVASECCILRKINKKEFDEIILANQDGLSDKFSEWGNQYIQKKFTGFFQFSLRARQQD